MKYRYLARQLHTWSTYGLAMSLCVTVLLIAASSKPRQTPLALTMAHRAELSRSPIEFRVASPRESFHVVESNKPLDTIVKNKLHKSALKRVRGQKLNIFVFSAIVGNSSKNASWDRLAIQGWEVKNYSKELACCVHYTSGNLAAYSVNSVHWFNFSRMVATQYLCPLEIPKNESLAYATVAASARTCHRLLNWHLVPNFSYRHENQIAVCTKLAYGSLSADDILTWFEVHRRFGMNKALTFTHKLNANATKVLQYYQSTGLAEIVPFDLPRTGVKRPGVGVKNMQAWTDEQVCVFDCLERLRGYKYVLTIDFDEYLMPKREKSLNTLFDKLFTKKPRAAGFHFLVQLHVTSWGQTGYASQFKVGQYLNRTKSMPDRMKHVVRPDRLKNGGLATHGFIPNYSMGYKRFRASENDVVIHHFRSCRKDWDKKNRTRCEDLKRYTDTTVADFMLGIEASVLSLKQSIFNGS